MNIWATSCRTILIRSDMSIKEMDTCISVCRLTGGEGGKRMGRGRGRQTGKKKFGRRRRGWEANAQFIAEIPVLLHMEAFACCLSTLSHALLFTRPCGRNPEAAACAAATVLMQSLPGQRIGIDTRSQCSSRRSIPLLRRPEAVLQNEPTSRRICRRPHTESRSHLVLSPRPSVCALHPVPPFSPRVPASVSLSADTHRLSHRHRPPTPRPPDPRSPSVLCLRFVR